MAGQTPNATGPRNAAQGWWDKRTPTFKRNSIIAGAIASFFAIMIPVMSTDGPPVRGARGPRSVGNLLTPTSSRELGISSLEQQVRDLRQEVAKKDRQVTDTGAVTAPDTSALNAEVAAELERLRARLEQVEAGGATSVATPGVPPPSGTLLAQGADEMGTGQAPPRANQPPPPPAAPQIRTISSTRSSSSTSGVSEEKPASDATSASRPSFYLPTGSIIPGVLLTGLDAPTGRAAAKEPVPALIRVKADAILPNRYRADVTECFVSVAGVGDLSSERVFLRGEAVSCISDDGGVIDMPIKLYVVDETSKAGLRGNLVSKQGQVIGKALLAGFAEGASRAFSGNQGFGGGQGVDFAQTGQSAAYGGFGSALDRVAQYYLDLANETFPVLEISAGRPVTLIVLKGTEMALVSR